MMTVMANHVTTVLFQVILLKMVNKTIYIKRNVFISM